MWTKKKKEMTKWKEMSLIILITLRNVIINEKTRRSFNKHHTLTSRVNKFHHFFTFIEKRFKERENFAQKRCQRASNVVDRKVLFLFVMTQCWSSQRMLFTVVLMRFFNLVISIFNAINLSSIFAKVNEFEEFDEETTNETTTDETTTDETTTDEAN